MVSTDGTASVLVAGFVAPGLRSRIERLGCTLSATQGEGRQPGAPPGRGGLPGISPPPPAISAQEGGK